jgi:hypothetical protein
MKKISTFLVLFLVVVLAFSNPKIIYEKSQKISDSLVAYFPFNGNANDESGNGHNGTIFGATITTDRYNVSGKAYNFIYNGYTSDKIEVPGTSDINFSGKGFTLSAWVKFSGSAGAGNNYPIISKHICGEQSGYILMLYNSKLTFWLAGSAGYNVVSTPDEYTDNSWHQVTSVYDGTIQSIYVDGVLKSSIAFSYNTFNTANLALGGYNGCNGGFNGKVDEIKIFNLPLTAEEILSEYNQSKISLVAYFPFNGNANDESGNGHDGTVNGGILTVDRNNSQNSAYTFPDAHSNIALANTTTVNLQSGFTINTWIKYKNVNCGIAGKHNCWVVNGFYLGIDYGQIILRIANSVWSDIRTDEVFEENKWYMVTGVFDSVNGTGSVYINGILKASESATYNNFNTAPITISEASNGCPDGNMPGSIDEVKIFNLPLTAEEILSEYNQSKPTLVAYFPFNGNASDESGNGSNPTFIGSGVTLTSDRFGNPYKAYYFDGNDSSYIRIPADKFPTTDRTISFWFNADQIENHPTPLSYGGDVCYNSVLMIINKGGYPNAYTVLAHCASNFISAPYSVDPINKWYYLTMTISGATQKIFINGELLQTANTFSTPTFVAGKSVIMGAIVFTDGNTVYKEPTAGNFKGKLDDFRFYDIALTDSEVKNLFNTESGLVAYYPFNGNAEDVSGNQNNGVVNNAVLTTDRYGNMDKAYAFNGINSYIEGTNPGNNLPTGNSPRTFCAWAKDNVFQESGSSIFHYGTAENAPTNFHLLITDVLGLGNGYSYGGVFGNSKLIDSTWHFLCGTYSNADQTVRLYVDGKIDNSGVLSTAPNTVLSTNWRIGLYMASGTPFNGKLDDIRVFKTVLTDQEVSDIYALETTAPILQEPSDGGIVITETPTMQWSSSFINAEYKFQISTDPKFTTVLNEVNITNLSFQLPDGILGMLDDGTICYWRVRTTLNGETGPWSNVWSFAYTTTGIKKDLSKSSTLTIFPNPSNSSSKIIYSVPTSASGLAIVSIEIINSLGNTTNSLMNTKLVPGKYEFQLNTQTMKPGIYFVKLKTGNTNTVRKLVILH